MMRKWIAILMLCLLMAGCAATTDKPAESLTAAPAQATQTPTDEPAAQTPEDEPAAQTAEGGYAGPVFSVDTVQGGSLDENYIKDNALTMVNCWATWCPPCVAELPDLARLHDRYAGEEVNFGILGLMLDEDTDAAGDLIADAEIGYPIILLNEAFAGMAAEVYAVPTTFFLDSNGNQVGEPQIGAKSLDDWAALVDELIAGLNP